MFLVYHLEPHSARELFSASHPPAPPGQAYEVLQGTVGDATEAYLAEQQQISVSERNRTQQGQFAQLHPWEAKLQSWTQRILGVAGILALVVLVGGMLGYGFRSNTGATMPGMNQGATRIGTAVAAAAILGTAALYPGVVIEYTSKPQAVAVKVSTLSWWESLSPDKLATAQTERHILDPYIRSTYSSSKPVKGSNGKETDVKLDLAVARVHAAKVLRNEAVPATEIQDYQGFAAARSDRKRMMAARGSNYYAIGRNGPSWLLGEIVRFSRPLLTLCVFLFLPMVALRGFLHGRLARILWSSYIWGLLPVSAAGLFGGGFVLAIYSWVGVWLVQFLSFFDSGTWFWACFIGFPIVCALVGSLINAARWAIALVRWGIERSLADWR